MSFSKATEALLKAVSKVFGTSVTYTHVGDSSTSEIKAVFDYNFVEVNGVTTRRPTLRVRLADLAHAPTEGDTAEIGSDSFTIMDSQPDSFGESILILEKT